MLQLLYLPLSLLASLSSHFLARWARCYIKFNIFETKWKKINSQFKLEPRKKRRKSQEAKARAGIAPMTTVIIREIARLLKTFFTSMLELIFSISLFVFGLCVCLVYKYSEFNIFKCGSSIVHFYTIIVIIVCNFIFAPNYMTCDSVVAHWESVKFFV